MVRITPAEFNATTEKIAKINARAANRGFTGRITIEAEAVEVTTTNEFGFKVTEKMLDVTIGGEAPAYNGWAFLATLDFDQHAGLITRVAPGVDEVNIDREALAEGHCDHCNTVRFRRSTYVVRNVETGEQKQVGSTCIKDFLGWEGGIVWLSEDEVESDLAGGWGLGGGERDYATETVLAVAWAAIRAFGYVRAGDWDRTPTKNVVATVLNPGKSKADRELVAALTPFVADSAEAAAKTRAFILSEEFSGTSEYVINLKAIAAADYTTDRNIGLLASAPQALARHEETTLIRKEKEAKPSIHFGAKGDKVEFTGTIETIRYIESAYGSTVLYSIRNAESGQIVKWFASREALGQKTGVEVSIKGTIKGHEEFRGIKSTVLTRCKAL